MDDYPTEIDLGREEPGNLPVSPMGSENKGKKRIFYPTLYIDAIEGMPALPREGCMMVRFRRKRMSVEEGMDGKETSGVTLEIRKLCLPEDMADGNSLEDAFKKLGKGEVSEYAEDYAEDDE